MKTRIYLIFAILCTMFSCAEEGPYRMGKLETIITAQNITPTTAEIQVTIPKNGDNLINWERCNAYLTINRINATSDDWRAECVKGGWFFRNEGKYEFLFENLQPDKQYFLILEFRMDLNKEGTPDEYMDNYIYYTDYSFTTTKEGDYSNIGEAHCELLESLDGYTKVRITLPSILSFPAFYESHPCLEASTSQNMDNPVKAEVVEYIKGSYNQAEFVFFNLSADTYYLRLYSVFSVGEEDNIFYYIGDNNSPAVININNPLVISGNHMKSISQLAFSGNNFTILRIFMPEEVWKTDYHSATIVKNVSCMSASYDSKECSYNDYLGYNSYCDVYLPCFLRRGEELDLTLSCSPYINGEYRNIKIRTKYIVNEENQILANPTIENLFCGTDYLAVKVKYPSTITIPDNNKLKYFISEDKYAEDSYKLITGNLDNYMLIKSTMNSNQYLQVDGDFKICGFDIQNGRLDIDGSISYPENGQRLFDITTQNSNANLNLIITPPSGFEFRNNGYTVLTCKIQGATEEVLFEVRANSNLSSSGKFVFTLSPILLETLEKGKKYILSVTGLYLAQGMHHLNSSNDVFELEWIYQ